MVDNQKEQKVIELKQGDDGVYALNPVKASTRINTDAKVAKFIVNNSQNANDFIVGFGEVIRLMNEVRKIVKTLK
jgi:hypothetical protein